MPKSVTKIFSARHIVPIWEQQLRVAAYCRVSTKHEEQQRSLETQINYYSNYIRSNPNWELVDVHFDTASGVHTHDRPGYQQLMRDCTKKEVDLILVKSLSRFGRDALETIRQIRRLKKMSIGVYIENGGLNTLNVSNSMIDQLAALDQAESQFRSENIKFGIRHRMRSGKAVLNHTQFLGYTKGSDGILQIVPEEAEIVRKIFDLYIQGNGVRKIKRYLEEHGIKTVTGKAEWSTSTIDRMLSNEKYIGEVLMQKTYTSDFLTGKREKNRGQFDSYRVENAHEPIMDKKIFRLVQLMKGTKRREVILKIEGTPQTKL
ncbi:MAG: recombinase family protein [Ruminococcus flavefaciens]|nr:recombinase family protein [Ruminococcus flavefaciens]